MKNGAYRYLVKGLTMFLILGMVMGCSKDDNEATSNLVVGELSSEFKGFCDHSSGLPGVFYEIQVPVTYDGTEDDGPSQLLVTLTSDGGNVSEDTTDLSDFGPFIDSNSYRWSGCLVFLGDWIDFEVQMESTGGETSNTSKIRLNITDVVN
ncbi:hypothetical protein [Ulvibacterium sp.]|uniref:hypothetical protein n=1 Tax=Ulvibacterium sp. TaxID=2665914 RepID=UPI00262967CB|nr:hypothetical protein [Ulvibacterium sp.]